MATDAHDNNPGLAARMATSAFPWIICMFWCGVVALGGTTRRSRPGPRAGTKLVEQFGALLLILDHRAGNFAAAVHQFADRFMVGRAHGALHSSRPIYFTPFWWCYRSSPSIPANPARTI